jgi:hypothetical protein
MFSLHEITKIRLCRAGFLALCLGPFCAVVLWCGFVRLDIYRARHERAIGETIGWQTKLGAVELPRPGLVLYRDLQLADPHTGQLLAELPYVEIDSRGETPLVRLPFPALVNAARLDAFWNASRELARKASATSRLEFEAQNLMLRLAHGDETLTDIRGEFNADDVQATAKFTFNRAIAGQTQPEASELTIARRTHAGLPQYTIDLATGPTPLPAELVAAIWPNVSQLGRKCEFAGRALAIEDGGAWRVELQGNLTDIDLDLVMRSFRHKLSGVAHLQLDRVTTVGGRIESATGSLYAGPGVISRSLVQSAETHLHVRATDAAARGGSNLLDYQLLCASFDVGEHGIAIRGAVPSTRGVLLVDAQRELVYEPPAIRQPVVDLVRTLVPQSEVQVPATKETVALTSFLPVPSIRPEPGHEEPLMQVQILKITPRPLRQASEPTGNPYPRR